MGLFDKMFGSGAAAAHAPDTQARFNELKAKYQSVLNLIEQQGVQLQNLHVQDNKLFIRGTAPSETAKNAIWDQIKLINPNADDITAEITVDESLGKGTARTGQTYTVQAGDTLSKISHKFYGEANEYMVIFYANQDRLRDPDKIQIGQELRIPPATS
jgi:nucleoid-associated protein YgaU